LKNRWLSRIILLTSKECENIINNMENEK